MMTMTKTNRIGMLLLSGALAITAAACSSDEGDDEETDDTAALAEDSSADDADEDPADSEEPVEPEETEPVETEPEESAEPVDEEPDDEPEPEPDEPDPVSGGTEACLVGEWEGDNEYFLAQMQEFGGVVDDVTGRVTLTYAPDGTFTTNYQDWTITGSAEGQAIAITRTGMDQGTYSIQGDIIGIRDTTMGSTTTLTAAGMTMSVDPEPVSYTEATFTCDASTAKIVTEDGDMILTR